MSGPCLNCGGQTLSTHWTCSRACGSRYGIAIRSGTRAPERYTCPCGKSGRARDRAHKWCTTRCRRDAEALVRAQTPTPAPTKVKLIKWVLEEILHPSQAPRTVGNELHITRAIWAKARGEPHTGRHRDNQARYWSRWVRRARDLGLCLHTRYDSVDYGRGTVALDLNKCRELIK